MFGIDEYIAPIYAALNTNLSEMKVTRYGRGSENLPDQYRRPSMDDIQVYSFPQQWGSTALGFGGVGGAAMTTAQTVVVVGYNRDACVYFGGQFAYRVPKVNQRFYDDINSQMMADVMTASIYDTP